MKKKLLMVTPAIVFAFFCLLPNGKAGLANKQQLVNEECDESFFLSTEGDIPAQLYYQNLDPTCRLNLVAAESDWEFEIQLDSAHLAEDEWLEIIYTNYCGEDTLRFTAQDELKMPFPIVANGFSIRCNYTDVEHLFFSISYAYIGDFMQIPTAWAEAHTLDFAPVSGVDFTFQAPDASIECTTAESGQCITDQEMNSTEVEILPNKNDDTANGLSGLDQVFILKHILGVNPIENPYLLLAADVNNSGDISIEDIIELRKVILRIQPVFSNNTSWRFVPQCFEFTDPQAPWDDDIPVYIENGVFENPVFIGIKVGDVDLSANPL